jgi:hypothetical protein
MATRHRRMSLRTREHNEEPPLRGSSIFRPYFEYGSDRAGIGVWATTVLAGATHWKPM